MPRFNANLTLLFNEVPFLERFAAARRAGFEAVEFLFPYAYAPEVVAQAAADAGVRIVLHNLPPGDWDAGERGIACHPDRVAEFRAGVATGIRYALALGVPQLNCLAGLTPSGVPEGDIRSTLVSNLRYAARALAEVNVRLLVEPINTFDMPGFYIHRTQQCLDLLDEVGEPNVFLQYDIYHAQRMEGELANTLRRAMPRIGHMQLADTPGRHEPGTGEINFGFLFEHIDALGYAGWIGCEYRPRAGTEAGLGWRTALTA